MEQFIPLEFLDFVFIVIGAICLVVGIIGSILPVLPGPPIGFVALLLLHFSSMQSFSVKRLVLFAVLAVGVTVLDYFVPAWGTKKMGGTKYGIWGSTIGLIVGLFFGPPGIILGPFIGALAGELLFGGNGSSNALRAAFGSFLGFLAGTLAKLVVMGYFCYEFIAAFF